MVYKSWKLITLISDSFNFSLVQQKFNVHVYIAKILIFLAFDWLVSAKGMKLRMIEDDLGGFRIFNATHTMKDSFGKSTQRF